MASIKQTLELSRSLQSASDSWKLDAELLLAHVLGKPREYLFTWPDAQVTKASLRTFEDLLKRRAMGEPVAYLTGSQGFWDFELNVNSSVLVPRPETELLVEKAIALGEALKTKDVTIADLGTGSGAIAIALAKHNPLWQITAVDRSAEALVVAKDNGARLSAPNVKFLLSSWCADLSAASFDIIVANPPYVEAGDAHLDEGSLPFEPIMALVADNHGMADIQQIVAESKRCLKPGGWLLIEHGYNQSQQVATLLDAAGYLNVGGSADLAGIDRVCFGQWQN